MMQQVIGNVQPAPKGYRNYVKKDGSVIQRTINARNRQAPQLQQF